MTTGTESPSRGGLSGVAGVVSGVAAQAIGGNAGGGGAGAVVTASRGKVSPCVEVRGGTPWE